MTLLTKIFQFSASHRLYSPQLTNEENVALFGQCVRDHGHNYTLEVTVSGPINPKTGLIINAQDLKAIIQSEVIVDVDHYHLNHDVRWLDGKLPSVEQLVESFWERIAPVIETKAPGIVLHRLKLWETTTIFAERTRS